MTDDEKLMLHSCSQRLDGVEERLANLEGKWDAIYKMASSIELLAQRVGYIEHNIGEQNKKLDALSNTFNETEKRVTNRISDAECRPYKDSYATLSGIKASVITSILSLIACGILGAVVIFGK